MSRIALVIAGLVIVVIATASSNVARARTLTMGIAVETTTLDPHWHNYQNTHAALEHIFEPLTYQTPYGNTTPWLAESWRTIDPQTWEFTLRAGVRFQDGTPLDPDDVTFTYARVPEVHGPSSYAHFIEEVASIERVGERHLRVHTRQPAPFLPFNLASVPILSRIVHRDIGTQDFNAGRGMIGTGAYRFVSFARGDRLVLARNPDWWGPKQAWDEVILRTIPNDPARLAALLAGEIDLADRMAPDDLPRLRADSALALFSSPAHQVIYLFPDMVRDQLPLTTDNANRPLAANPTRDPRVRRALSIAINRRGIAEQIMAGSGYPADQMVAAGAIGRDETLKVPSYDPARARALLADAGYPEGWKWTLIAPSGLYQNDTKIGQAIAQMWTRIGVQTALDTLPAARFYDRLNARAYPILMTGYLASVSITVLRGNFLPSGNEPGNGGSNRMDYRNPEFDSVFLDAASQMDDAKRAAGLARSMRIVMDDNANIPVIFTGYNWATRRDRVKYLPGPRGVTQAMWASPP